MRKNIQNAFSLMEMMVVLLIVAIIAAATAPMVTKKMMRSAGSGDSPWVFTGLNNDIAYNMNGGNSSAIIGAPSYSPGNNEPTNPRLVLANGGANRPSLVFADSNGAYSGQINMDSQHRTVTMNDAQVGEHSVAIGLGQTIGDDRNYVVAIGDGVQATNNGAIAIGTPYAVAGGNAQAQNSETIASGTPSLAIGNCVKAEGNSSIAIGHGLAAAGQEGVNGFYTQATGIGAIAIGSQYTQATAANAIAIGTRTMNRGALGAESIAIGLGASATETNSIAIGNGATATRENSVAIGNGARTYAGGEIVLGTEHHTVYIPGNLAVGGYVFLNANPGKATVLRAANGRELAEVRHHNFSSHDDNLRRYGTDLSGVEQHNFFQVYIQRYFQTHPGTSDRRLKNVGEKYMAGLNELKKLDLYHYTFKDDKENTPRVGVMAQDLQKVFPDAVTKGDDGYLRIRLEDMFYAVINAVKELDTKISQIIADVSGLSAKVEEQQKVIDEQALKIEALEKQNLELRDEIKDIEKQIKKIK